MNKIIPISTIVLLLSVYLTACAPSSQQEGDLSIEEFLQWQEKGYLTLDVRTKKEHNSGHIPGSTLLDYYDPLFESKSTTLPKEDTLLLYCRSGKRSGKAKEFLEENGYLHVYQLDGGYMAYKAAKQ